MTLFFERNINLSSKDTVNKDITEGAIISPDEQIQNSKNDVHIDKIL